MAFAVVLPKMGMTMVEGTVTNWFVRDGDTVAVGDPLFAFETEKVNYDVTAEAAGVVRLLADATVAAGAVVAYVLAEGEELPADAPSHVRAPAEPRGSGDVAATPSGRPPAPPDGRTAVRASPVAKRLADEQQIDLTQIRGTGPGGRVVRSDVEAAIAAGEASPAVSAPSAAGRVRASPAARRLAAEHQIDLHGVFGSGPEGRILKEDVEAALRAPPAGEAPAAPEPLPYRGIRRTIGQRMLQSLQSMAQLTMAMEVDMTDAARLRRDLLAAWETAGVRVSYTDMVVKAAALALREHPRLNALLDGDLLRIHPEVHVGVAVALDEGLLVPVIRQADVTPLQEIARESAALAERARVGGLTPDDLTGGTFTVTSLGMYDVDVFTPIINPPQAAILGVGRIVQRPAFVDDVGTAIERRAFLTLSLTFDHRVVDGAPAAQYLQSVRRRLEHPYLLLTSA